MSDSPAAILYDSQGRIAVGVGLFGGLQVTSPYTLVDYNHKYNINTVVWGTLTATGGSVTHLPNESAARLTATASNGSRAVLRTHEYYRYQSGKTLVTRFSIYHSSTGHANQTRRWGVFDDDDGLFFELNATLLRVVRRSSTSGSVVDTAVAQASWNVDKLDGSGPSGVTLDITKGSIYEVDFAWLGVGTVRFKVNGILVHEMIHDNTLSTPYMKTAVLPMQMEIVNTGASTGASMTSICTTVLISGGQDAPEFSFAAYTASDVSVGTTERPVISIRPKLTFNSIVNRMVILPKLFAVSTEGARAGYRIVVGNTLTGASWVSADSESGVEYDVSATALAGGSTLLRGFLPNSNDTTGPIFLDKGFSQHGRKLHLDAFGSVQPVITIAAINEQAGSTAMRASVGWVEIR